MFQNPCYKQLASVQAQRSKQLHSGQVCTCGQSTQKSVQEGQAGAADRRDMEDGHCQRAATIVHEAAHPVVGHTPCQCSSLQME
jgi:hypothetical protein